MKKVEPGGSAQRLENVEFGRRSSWPFRNQHFFSEMEAPAQSYGAEEPKRGVFQSKSDIKWILLYIYIYIEVGCTKSQIRVACLMRRPTGPARGPPSEVMRT